MHALDDTAHEMCLRALPSRRAADSCVRDADCCTSNQSLESRGLNARRSGVRNRAEKFRLVEAVLMHRLAVAVRELNRSTRPLVLLDVTALVASRACLDEMRSYPEDIVRATLLRPSLGSRYTDAPESATARV